MEIKIPWPLFMLMSANEYRGYIVKSRDTFIVPLFAERQFADDFVRRSNLDCRTLEFVSVSDMKHFLEHLPGYPSLSDVQAPVFIVFDLVSLVESGGYPIPRADVLMATSHWHR